MFGIPWPSDDTPGNTSPWRIAAFHSNSRYMARFASRRTTLAAMRGHAIGPYSSRLGSYETAPEGAAAVDELVICFLYLKRKIAGDVAFSDLHIIQPIV